MTPLPSAFSERLSTRFGQRFSAAEAIRAQHAGAGMHLPALPPQAVVMAESTDEIVFAVRTCAEFGVPIIPFGAGTSLECHVGAPRGGLCIDVSGMKRVLRVDEADQDCTVEAGVTRVALNEHLRHTGLFFPVDPGADAVQFAVLFQVPEEVAKRRKCHGTVMVGTPEFRHNPAVRGFHRPRKHPRAPVRRD